ncbi:hypothetical protein CRYUN_Cryun11dG0101000 [Craigia yunnanensis]
MDIVAAQFKFTLLPLLAISLLFLPFLHATPIRYCGQAISDGKAVIDVKYFGVHIHQETHELCEETSCPIAVGDFVLSHNEALPGFTPPGSYTLTMKLLGEGTPQLTCITFDFKIAFGASGSLVSDS